MLKKDCLQYLCDNLRCKIASENRVLVLLVVFGVEGQAEGINKSTTLVPKQFYKSEANSVLQMRTR